MLDYKYRISSIAKADAYSKDGTAFRTDLITITSVAASSGP